VTVSQSLSRGQGLRTVWSKILICTNGAEDSKGMIMDKKPKRRVSFGDTKSEGDSNSSRKRTLH